MTHQKFQTLVQAAMLVIAIGSLTLAAEHLRAEESSKESVDASPKPSCELILEKAKDPKANHGQSVIVRIKNTGKTPVTLVQPGDGSQCNWRTPQVGWSIVDADSDKAHSTEPAKMMGGRCGNVNPLGADEVFDLAPGETKRINVWMGQPPTPKGRYRVACWYHNDPNIKWRGLPLGSHDPKAMERVKRSTPIKLISNEILMTFTK